MSGEAAWRTFTDVEAAKRSILKRHSLRDIDVPEALIERSVAIFGERIMPEEAVRRIIRDIRVRGDAAIREWNLKIDNINPDRMALSAEEMHEALGAIAPELRGALEGAAEQIRNFHAKQAISSWIDAGKDGTLGQLIRPVDSVGVYVPGGTAPLPSSLLMSVIPAQVAGVPQIVVCTPPGSGGGGIHPAILAAGAVAGLEKIYCIGGAQAIAAMAYGSETVPGVATIVGAGNLFVTLAKQQVYGDVGIDGLLGPTETLVIADESADPRLAAADLLAQAEHDVLASAILLTPSLALAEAVRNEISVQVAALDRQDIVFAAMDERCGAVVTADLDEAFQLANDYAAEHLCLLVADPWSWIGKVRNAGGVFLGEHSYEVLGDYIAGPSHVMPTGGTARFASPLNLLHFVKVTSLIALDKTSALALGPAAETLASAEGLTAHAAAARLRRELGAP
ncbi:MAG: histidinol dehydrogenase [Chloroflexi bacterium]|nr:histidinol dehydrogenase [Chloroflexota bacterium]